MNAEQSTEFWSQIYEGFEGATPLAFGAGDVETSNDWKLPIPSDCSATALIAAWGLLLARFTGEELVSFGFQGLEDSGPKALRLKVDEKQSSGDYLDSIAQQYNEQRQVPDNLHDMLGLDPKQPLFSSVAAMGNSILGSGSHSADTLEQVSGQLQRLISGLSVDGKVVDIQHLSSADLTQIIEGWNPAPTDYPEHSVHILFEEQVKKYPDAIAVIFEGQQVTYKDLNERANRLAHFLIRGRVKPGQSVALYLERGVEQIVATLATLKAGAAYIPLDTEFPIERIVQMMEDAAPPIIITQSSLSDCLDGVANTCLLPLDQIVGDLKKQADTNPAVADDCDALAYIMYTSGSTGRPKGVEILQRGIIRLLINSNYVPFSPDTVVLHMAAVSFDASTFEIWAPLLHGGTCVLCPSRVPTLETIGQLIAEHHVNTLWMTSSLFNLTVAEAPQILKPVNYLLSGGEALSAWHVEKALKELPDLTLINGYGPTENTTFSTTHRFDRNTFSVSRPISIGRAIGNSTCYILDRFLRPLPVGVPGELYVGGDGVARGYASRPDLTEERFLDDPFSKKPNARMYKTGDIVYWNAEGLIEFIGRVDNQVKLRGFRIELQDIDVAVGSYPGVEQAVTEVYNDDVSGKWLATFIKVENSDGFPLAELEKFAYEKLPDYMVPAVFVPVAEWAYTPSGKLDRTALPKPDLAAQRRKNFKPPETPTQETLVDLWQRTLKVPTIGIDDNFFEIGGDSLRAVHLFHETSQRFNRDLPLSLLTQHPTIRGFSAVIDGNTEEDVDALSDFRCLQMVQKGAPEIPPLFMIHGGAGNVVVFRKFAQHLGEHQPVYAFQWSGWDGRKGHETISEMAQAYKEELLRFQRLDRYRLGGHCIGGLIALELAALLRKDGIEVDGPVIVSDCPNLESSKHWKTEPENDEASKRRFFKMVDGLKAQLVEGGSWETPELPRLPSGFEGRLKRSPLVIGLIRWLRSAPRFMKLKQLVASGKKVPVSERPFYASRTLLAAAKQHHAKPYAGDILYFRSECVQGSKIGLQGWWEDPYMGFSELCGGTFEGHVIGGGHNEVLDNPLVIPMMPAPLKARSDK